MEKKKPTHLNDRTRKYESAAQAARQHQYLGLPGTFKTRNPTEIVFPNMDSGRMDELYSTEEGMLIDLEEESKPISEKTLWKFGKYVVFVSFMYSIYVYLAVICHNDPHKLEECFQLGPSLFIKVHYYYISQAELWDKYDNLINKVSHNIKLTDMEALDISFIPKFISKEYAQYVTKSMTTVFNDAIIDDKKLKIDVAVILGAMILKHFSDEKTQNRLLEKINMREYESEIQRLAYEEYGHILDPLEEKIQKQSKELETKDKELETKDKELKAINEEIDNLNNFKSESKSKLKKLMESDNFDSNEAKKIINSILML